MKNKLAQWVERKYEKVWGKSILPNFDDTINTPLIGHKIVTSYRKGENYELVLLDWSHPDSRDRTMLWNTVAIIARVDDKTEVAFLLRVGSSEFVIRPANYQIFHPKIVSDLLECCPCTINGKNLSNYARAVTIANIEDFKNDHLLAEDRRFPIFLISPDNDTGKYYIEPKEAQKRFLGIAQVAYVHDKWAGYALTDAVGKPFTCFDGAVRVYWPGLSLEDSPFHHPLFTKQRLLSYGGPQVHLDHLYKMVASITALRYVPGPTIRMAHRLIAEDKKQKQESMVQELKRREDYDGLLEALEAAWEEGEIRNEENDRLKKQVEDLQVENSLLQQNLIEVTASIGRMPEEIEQTQEPVEFHSVIDALRAAKNQFEGLIEVYDCALKSASDSQYSNPDKIFQTIEAISEVSREHFEAARAEASIGPWEKAFEQRGFHYKPKESEMTMNLHGKERDFAHDGKKTRMEKHITIGGGDRTNCIQIYFEPNSETEKIEIGYCGPHLPYYSQRT